eukprot:3769420-Rhodomonas_salina.1
MARRSLPPTYPGPITLGTRRAAFVQLRARATAPESVPRLRPCLEELRSSSSGSSYKEERRMLGPSSKMEVRTTSSSQLGKCVRLSSDVQSPPGCFSCLVGLPQTVKISWTALSLAHDEACKLTGWETRHSQPVGPDFPGWDESTSTRTPSKPQRLSAL